MIPTSAMEDYLEAILIMSGKNTEVRVTDLAKHLNIKPPSVIEMIQNMKKKDLVIHETRKDIQLTTSGKNIAEKIKQRHDLLLTFFVNVLGLDKKTADNDACAIEHVLSNKSYERLIQYTQFIGKQKQSPSDWFDSSK